MPPFRGSVDGASSREVTVKVTVTKKSGFDGSDSKRTGVRIEPDFPPSAQANAASRSVASEQSAQGVPLHPPEVHSGTVRDFDKKGRNVPELVGEPSELLHDAGRQRFEQR